MGQQDTDLTLGEQIVDQYGEHILLADGFEDAFVGIAEIHGLLLRACYDRDKCIKILFDQFVESGKGDETHDEIWDGAVEYFDFNVAGAYVGEATPAFLTVYPSKEG